MRVQVYMFSNHPFNSFYLDTLESLKFCDWFRRLEIDCSRDGVVCE
jgi:hypothetical protein